MASRFQPGQPIRNNNDHQLVNHRTGAVIYNAIPWHRRNHEIQYRRNFTELLNSTRSYNVLNDRLEDIYQNEIEDIDLPREIRENIDLILSRDFNALLDRELTRSSNTRFTPVNLTIDSLRNLFEDENEDPRSPDDFYDEFKNYIKRTFNVSDADIRFSANLIDVLKHYYEIYSSRRQRELSESIMANVERSRYNIMMFPVGLNFRTNKVEWHLLCSVPLFNARHIIELQTKVHNTVMRILQFGSEMNRSFKIDTLKFYIYQRPYSPSQIFKMNNLLTLSASLVSPTFQFEPTNIWNFWVDNLSNWFRVNGADISSEDFVEQFSLEINIDHTSYLRLDELFAMLETIYREGISKRPHSYIFVIDVGMSANVNPHSLR
jgi:hypothetical protein